MDPDSDTHNFYMNHRYTDINYKQQVSIAHTCCEVTILVDLGHRQYVQRSGALVDPLAPANFISRELVRQLQLATIQISPKEFTLHGGATVTYTEKVEVSLEVGGAQKNITAFVDDSNGGWLFVLEASTSAEFLRSIGVQLVVPHTAMSMSLS